jgi:biopolymer transport protein ExbB/TolQ
MARDERRMTFVVVPHGGSRNLSTRSYELSYRTLRLLAVGGAVVTVLLFLMAASWVWIGAQAARVPLLEHQVTELQKERQERERLARQLARMQATYEQIRVMLKGELPPLDSIEAQTRAAGGRVGGDSTAPPADSTATDEAAADSGDQ